MNKIQFPVHFLDFEASGLHGVPIEIGVATLFDGGKIETWSRLIRPAPEWIEDDDLWDPLAVMIHGVSREQLLDEGEDPRRVMKDLKERVGVVAHFQSDAPGFEAAWLGHLLDITDHHEKTKYRVTHYFDVLKRRFGSPSRAFFLADTRLEETHKPHRAGPDAEILAKVVGKLLLEGITG